MKATTIILAAAITLQTSIIFAGNVTPSVPVTNETTAIAPALLAPSTPEEATFEEIASTLNLAPMAPSVADFEEPVDAFTPDAFELAPVAPSEATFE